MEKCNTDICKSTCCGFVPVQRDIYENNKHLIERNVDQLTNLNDHVMVIDENMVCSFLSLDYKCLIYKNRPEICKTIGGSDHKYYKCKYK